jgi:hypothetical protein
VLAAAVALPVACVRARAPETLPLPVAENDGVVGEAATIHEDAASPASAPELPRGGRTVFPRNRLVGFCGTPGAPALGELRGDLAAKAEEIERRGALFDDGRQILPVFELIAVVVQAWPGSDGKHRHRVEPSVVDEYLRAARRARALLLLNIQPGQSDFLTEAKAFEAFLREPDVGLALDPEWAMRPDQHPGDVYGQTTGAAVNGVVDFLAALVAEGNLPEKVLVFHEVVKKVVKDEPSMRALPGVIIVKSIDGLGPAPAKMATYDYLMKRSAPDVHPGFKLFFDEDTQNGGHLMTPEQVLGLSPRPEYVMYE